MTSEEEKCSRYLSLLKWNQVCQLLDKVQLSKLEKKKELITKFIANFRDCFDDTKILSASFLPILRILIPNLDKGRGAYGLKERKLSDLYIKVLAIRKDSTDGQKLLNYRGHLRSLGRSVNDFAEVAYHTLKNYCPAQSSISLLEVDRCLSLISKNYVSKEQASTEKTFTRLIRVMTACEQKWLIRVLLKDMHLGIGRNFILSCWHPDAKEYYDVTNSLVKVCSVLCDPCIRLHEIEISLFSPFRPMLAERCDFSIIESRVVNKEYISETKFDGERSQIHKRGNKYKYFSRNGNDFTSNFGSDPSNGIFTPSVHPLFLPSVSEAILDGELIGWSQKYKSFVTKSQHIDVKNVKENENDQVCFCVFDILLLNGKVLTNLPLRVRRDYLTRVITPSEGRVVIAKQTQVSSKDDVVAVFNKAIDDREEGIVLKDLDSVYMAASRTSRWIKLKPDYVSSCIRDLDLLIIGGYYGKGQSTGLLSHFLLAVSAKKVSGSEQQNSFYSVCRVSSGFSFPELEELTFKLIPRITERKPSNVFVAKEKPDVWFFPENSCILQVNAAEISKSSSCMAGYALRFPRVQKIRFDKPWFDVLDLEDLHRMVQNSDSRMIQKYNGKEESPKDTRKVRRNIGTVTLPDYYRPSNLNSIQQKGDIFLGKEFCVMAGVESLSKKGLETLIIEHGGTISQHPGKSTFCVICDRLSVKAQNLIDKKSINVVKSSWVRSCVEKRRLLSWSPLEVFHLTPKDEQRMQEEFDRFGDSFYEKTDSVSLKNLMNLTRLDPAEIQKRYIYPKEIMREIRKYSFEKRNIFRGVNGFFTKDGITEDLSCLLVRLKFRMRGGNLQSNIDENTSHIVLTSPRTTVKHIENPQNLPILTSECIMNSSTSASFITKLQGHKGLSGL